MRLRSAAWILVALLGTTGGAFAATATPEGAQAVKAQLARFFGAAPLTVTPAGEAYAIDIDVKATLKGLERFGVVLDPAVYKMNATPKDDGTWHVTSGALPLLTVKVGGQTTSIVANNQSFDGIFDPRVPAFTSSTSSYDSLSIGTVTDGKAKGLGTVQTRELQHGRQTLTTSPAGDGIVDAKMVQSNGAYAQDIVIDAAKGATHIAVKGGATEDTVAIDKLPVRALLDLWAFLVAHPTQAELKTNQVAFKDLLRHVVPLFTHLSQDGTLNQVSVATPIGPVAARMLTTHFDTTGLTEAGTLGLGVEADDLVLPNALLPAWAPALMPTGIDLHDSLSGFRLDKAATSVIDGLDLADPNLLPPEAKTKVQEALGSRDTLVVKLDNNRITTPTLDLRFGGEVHVTAAIPSFSVTVHGTGLDKAIAAVRTTAAGDKTAAQAIAMLTLVKGYAKAEDNDAFTWDVAGDGTGEITVNGVPLPIGPAK